MTSQWPDSAFTSLDNIPRSFNPLPFNHLQT